MDGIKSLRRLRLVVQGFENIGDQVHTLSLGIDRMLFLSSIERSYDVLRTS